jgi:hypothetical protein
MGRRGMKEGGGRKRKEGGRRREKGRGRSVFFDLRQEGGEEEKGSGKPYFCFR